MCGARPTGLRGFVPLSSQTGVLDSLFAWRRKSKASHASSLFSIKPSKSVGGLARAQFLRV